MNELEFNKWEDHRWIKRPRRISLPEKPKIGTLSRQSGVMSESRIHCRKKRTKALGGVEYFPRFLCICREIKKLPGFPTRTEMGVVKRTLSGSVQWFFRSFLSFPCHVRVLPSNCRVVYGNLDPSLIRHEKFGPNAKNPPWPHLWMIWRVQCRFHLSTQNLYPFWIIQIIHIYATEWSSTHFIGQASYVHDWNPNS